MSTIKTEVGLISWVDLTVPDAEKIKEFYSKVIGWIPEPVSMGEYNDYNMTIPDDKTPAAGICNARGVNSDLPPQWLIYINVKDIEKSIQFCKELGGKMITEIKSMGASKYCVIQDPAGAYCTLFEHGKK